MEIAMRSQVLQHHRFMQCPSAVHVGGRVSPRIAAAAPPIMRYSVRRRGVLEIGEYKLVEWPHG